VHRRIPSAEEQLEHVDDVKPRIIWSRNKHTRRAEFDGADTGPYSAKQRKQQHVASAGGALPQRNTNQMSDAGRTADRSSQLQADGHSGNEIQSEQQSNFAYKDAKFRQLRSAADTAVAVDWLNNLLFVLDRCRLLVMDLRGNNELVLIDDFNANNRPVDMKVDPINGFLFWLQIGKFHNTIYKLDLSVLSMPSATQKLVSNALKLRQSVQTNTSNHDGLSFEASDLIPLVSHHYAHPIITNLPQSTKIFTIDYKHSRIYVPLSSPPTTSPSNGRSGDSILTDNSQAKRDDAEVFASTDDITHLNNTQSDSSFPTNVDCNQNGTSSTMNGGVILAYNLDGTDVGPLREHDEKSHISGLNNIQDLTLNSQDGLLYWLTNGGRDLFEEIKENSVIQPAQHYLYGKSYSKLIYFDDNDANQPTTQKSRFNVGKIIQILSSSISNRHTRSELEQSDSAIIMGLRNSDMGVTRNAPYIILGVTCLIVTTVYLIYALIFQRMQVSPGRANHCAGGSDSISGAESSIGSESQVDDNLNGFVNSTTISGWAAAPSGRGTETSTFDRDINSFNGRMGAYDIESTNYEASNAVDEHYRGSTLNVSSGDHSSHLASSRLANLSEWPANMHDLSNKLYVPVEVLQDEALSSIPRVSIDQLEIERRAPLGEGHFGTVLQGTIDCGKFQADNRHRLSAPCKAPISPDSLAPPSRSRVFVPSTSSSGHGSSSSTSCDFATANTCTDSTNRDDYLTPKNQLSSTASDYCVDMPANALQDGSCSGYCDTQDVKSFRTTAASFSGTKLRVAIKKLKDNASPEEKRDFLQEAKLLANFDHPNIVHLIGICLDRGSTLIIMELMLGGDLIRYMQENTPCQTNNYAEDLTYDDLLKICLDIANGCCYLEDMDYIHRDLAARNCLVSSRKREERVVKLADFGLARDIYKDSYYKKLNDSAMPLKWMAPECLVEQKFTKKSDVWSFGVVMWEVMSYCQEKPYSGVEPFFMKEHLASGARLRKPNCCDDSMYRLMNQCWQMEPNNRPTFHECRAMLIEIRNAGRL
jgi:serine/threonine protein kinase